MSNRVEEIKEQINEAFEETGSVPSYRSIHEKMSGGSMSTIRKAFEEWKSENADRLIPQYLLDCTRRLHDEVRAQSAAVVESLQFEALQAQEQFSNLSLQHTELKKMHTASKKLVGKLEKELDATKASLSKEQTRTAALEARVDDRVRVITELKERVSELKEQLHVEKADTHRVQAELMKLAANKDQQGVPLFARVRNDSDFRDQNLVAIDHHGLPFPVTVIAGYSQNSYVVQGGPGGQYRAADVDLYARVNGMFVCLSPAPAEWALPSPLPEGYTPANPEQFNRYKRDGFC